MGTNDPRSYRALGNHSIPSIAAAEINLNVCIVLILVENHYNPVPIRVQEICRPYATALRMAAQIHSTLLDKFGELS